MSQGRKKGYQQPSMKYLVETLVGETFGEDQFTNQGRHIQTPQADVYETSQEIIIIVDLPGISKENVDLFIKQNKIIVEAVKKDDKAPRNARYHCIERLFGKFLREIEIPATVHAGKVEASMNNGVLIIIVPKIEDRRGMKTRIKIS